MSIISVKLKDVDQKRKTGLGLTSIQALQNLKKYGLNQLPQRQRTSALKVLLGQVRNPFSYLLLGATLLSFVVGDKLDVFLIGGILILNTALGFWQGYKDSKEW